MYKDKEKQKKAASEAVKRHRAKKTESVIPEIPEPVIPNVIPSHDSGVIPSVIPDVNPIINPSDTSRRLDIVEGEIRTFRQAFLSLNDLLKRVKNLEEENNTIGGRISELEAPTERIKSGQQHQDIKRPAKGGKPEKKAELTGDLCRHHLVYCRTCHGE